MLSVATVCVSAGLHKPNLMKPDGEVEHEQRWRLFGFGTDAEHFL